MINFTDNRSCEKCIAPWCYNVGKKGNTPCMGFIDKFEETHATGSTVMFGIDISKTTDSTKTINRPLKINKVTHED